MVNPIVRLGGSGYFSALMMHFSVGARTRKQRPFEVKHFEAKKIVNELKIWSLIHAERYFCSVKFIFTLDMFQTADLEYHIGFDLIICKKVIINFKRKSELVEVR